jgi:hypothetical protein
MPLIIGQTNLDADNLVFFKRELEVVKAKAYDVKYPVPMITSIFPISSEAGPGAESITYSQFDSVGVAKFISDYADDLPRSDVKGKQFSILVQSIGGSYGWSIQEIRSANMAKRPLQQMRANAARRSNDNLVNRIGWFANGSAEYAGLMGILYHPNVSKSAATNGNWDTATPDQIIADVNNGIQSIADLTNNTDVCDTVGLPPKKYAKLATTARSSTDSTTILKFLKEVNPGVVFAPIHELKDVNPNPRTGAAVATQVMLCCVRNPDCLQLELPIVYEQFAAQERNLSMMVPVHSRIAGFNIYYPLTIGVFDGI